MPSKSSSVSVLLRRRLLRHRGGEIEVRLVVGILKVSSSATTIRGGGGGRVPDEEAERAGELDRDRD